MPASILFLAPRRPGPSPVQGTRVKRHRSGPLRGSSTAFRSGAFLHPGRIACDGNALLIAPLFALFRPVPSPSNTAPGSGHGALVPTDAELMARVAAGDERAFSEIYRRFVPGLFSMVHEIVGESEAEDVLQEAFVQMWKRAASYDPTRSSVFTWAVMIARHKAIDRLRSRQRGDRGLEVITKEWKNLHDGSEADSGSTVAAQHDDRARVLAALAKIPAEQREAIQLAFFRGLTHTAISDELKTALGTVKARIRRGLLALQGLLDKQ